MNYWIIPCNINKYQVFDSFKNLKRLNWKQSTNKKVGDIVYIYTSRPYSEMTHKCRVLEVDVKNVYINDEGYVIDGKSYKNHGRYMTLELIENIRGISLKWLNNNNVLGNIQGPRKIDFEI